VRDSSKGKAQRIVGEELKTYLVAECTKVEISGSKVRQKGRSEERGVARGWDFET